MDKEWKIWWIVAITGVALIAVLQLCGVSVD